MIPVFMLLFSAVALVQFFMSYCRSILASYAKVELSPACLELAGVKPGQIYGGEFGRLLGLVSFAPDPGDDLMELRTMRLYYSVVRMIGTTVAPFVKSARSWCESESARCAYFVAVALDRRITPVAG